MEENSVNKWLTMLCVWEWKTLFHSRLNHSHCTVCEKLFSDLHNY